MTSSAIEVVRDTTLEPSRDGRLVPYAAITIASLGAALLFGEPGLVPLAVPFLVALAAGLRRTAPVDVRVRIVLFSDRVLEGDPIRGRLEIAWDGEYNAHALIHRLRGVSVIGSDGSSAWVAGAERIELPLRFEAAQWGRHALGEIWLRLSVPFGLVTWTGRVAGGPPVRVLPGSERLTEILSPTHSRTAWGVHGSTRLGDGHDFAELRPYTPGDRLRDLNWAATARHGRPIVNRHHPEVSGDVVIALEAYDDGSAASTAVLARTARTAWALASAHMRANDRVGVVGLGGSTQWLPPAGGRLARYKLMDTLLRVGGDAVDKVAFTHRWVDVPQSALVIALSTLQDERSAMALMRWRRKGRSVAVVVIDPATVLDAPATDADRLARRLWGLGVENRIAELRRSGIAVVPAPVDGAMAPVVSALRRARRRTMAGRR